jgi:hypothetical protein
VPKDAGNFLIEGPLTSQEEICFLELVGWLVGLLFGCLVCWLVGWLIGWLVGWLVGWLDGWLVGWLVGITKDLYDAACLGWTRSLLLLTSLQIMRYEDKYKQMVAIYNPGNVQLEDECTHFTHHT